MAKSKNYSKAMRSVARKDYIAALRDGRKTRAQTFVDRKKAGSKAACRGKVSHDG